MECPSLVACDEHGKLPYDVQLRAPEERRRWLQSFAGAAAESFGSGSSSVNKTQKTWPSKSSEARSSKGDDESRYSSGSVGEMEEQEVQSPLKQQEKRRSPGKRMGGSGTSRQLDLRGRMTRHRYQGSGSRRWLLRSHKLQT
jgi:hypothetical protein